MEKNFRSNNHVLNKKYNSQKKNSYNNNKKYKKYWYLLPLKKNKSVSFLKNWFILKFSLVNWKSFFDTNNLKLFFYNSSFFSNFFPSNNFNFDFSFYIKKILNLLFYPFFYISFCIKKLSFLGVKSYSSNLFEPLYFEKIFNYFKDLYPISFKFLRFSWFLFFRFYIYSFFDKAFKHFSYISFFYKKFFKIFFIPLLLYKIKINSFFDLKKNWLFLILRCFDFKLSSIVFKKILWFSLTCLIFWNVFIGSSKVVWANLTNAYCLFFFKNKNFVVLNMHYSLLMLKKSFIFLTLAIQQGAHVFFSTWKFSDEYKNLYFNIVSECFQSCAYGWRYGLLTSLKRKSVYVSYYLTNSFFSDYLSQDISLQNLFKVPSEAFDLSLKPFENAENSRFFLSVGDYFRISPKHPEVIFKSSWFNTLFLHFEEIFFDPEISLIISPLYKSKITSLMCNSLITLFSSFSQKVQHSFVSHISEFDAVFVLNSFNFFFNFITKFLFFSFKKLAKYLTFEKSFKFYLFFIEKIYYFIFTIFCLFFFEILIYFLKDYQGLYQYTYLHYLNDKKLKIINKKFFKYGISKGNVHIFSKKLLNFKDPFSYNFSLFFKNKLKFSKKICLNFKNRIFKEFLDTLKPVNIFFERIKFIFKYLNIFFFKKLKNINITKNKLVQNNTFKILNYFFKNNLKNKSIILDTFSLNFIKQKIRVDIPVKRSYVKVLQDINKVFNKFLSNLLLNAKLNFWSMYGFKELLKKNIYIFDFYNILLLQNSKKNKQKNLIISFFKNNFFLFPYNFHSFQNVFLKKNLLKRLSWKKTVANFAFANLYHNLKQNHLNNFFNIFKSLKKIELNNIFVNLKNVAITSFSLLFKKFNQKIIAKKDLLFFRNSYGIRKRKKKRKKNFKKFRPKKLKKTKFKILLKKSNFEKIRQYFFRWKNVFNRKFLKLKKKRPKFLKSKYVPKNIYKKFFPTIGISLNSTIINFAQTELLHCDLCSIGVLNSNNSNSWFTFSIPGNDADEIASLFFLQTFRTAILKGYFFKKKRFMEVL